MGAGRRAVRRAVSRDACPGNRRPVIERPKMNAGANGTHGGATDAKGGRALAVIPARGGSKQVPRKNLKLLGGKPLIAWSIEAARASTELDRCIVSTDDEEIAEVARSL